MKQAKIEVSFLDACGSDITVVNAARVSFNKESEEVCVRTFDPTMSEELGEDVYEFEFVLSEKDKKLINYLAKHKHTSPFNHAFLSFRVKAPVFVARQLVKHKFLPWNEVSRRYVTDEPEFYLPSAWRKSAENVKQGSSDEVVDLRIAAGFNYQLGDLAQTPYEACDDMVTLYEELIGQGVCAEQARMVLPQNMMTEWYWSGTLGAWLDMLKLRLDSHTQKETREVAALIYAEVKELFPVSCAAYLGESNATSS